MTASITEIIEDISTQAWEGIGLEQYEAEYRLRVLFYCQKTDTYYGNFGNEKGELGDYVIKYDSLATKYNFTPDVEGIRFIADTIMLGGVDKKENIFLC